MPEDSAERFAKLVYQGHSALIEAAKIAMEELAKDPEWAERVHEKNKLITTQMVHRFANIGLKFIVPLAISECPGAKRLRNLDLDTQERYTKEPVMLLIKTENGWDTLRVDLYDLTSDQANQVFASDHVRTESEQRAWIEDQNAKRVTQPVKANLPYRMVGSTLIVMSPCQFKRKELAQILAELE